MEYKIIGGLESAKGHKEYYKHQRGEPLSPMQAIRSQCYLCLCGYSGGKVDCKTPACPLYPFMPYNKEAKSKKPKAVRSEKQKANDEKARERLREMAKARREASGA